MRLNNRIILPKPSEAEFKLFTAVVHKVFQSNEDVGRIVVLPLVMAELTWAYMLYTVEEAANVRLYRTIKVSREVRRAYAAFQSGIIERVGREEYEKIRECAKIFADDNEDHLQLLYFPANQALKNTGVRLTHERMQTLALSAYMLSGMCTLNRKEILKDVENRIGKLPYARYFDFTPEITMKTAILMRIFVGMDVFPEVNITDLNLRRAVAAIYIQFLKFKIEIDLNKLFN